MFCGNDGRTARQVLADVPADGTAPEIVAAAGAETDDHLHGFAGEIGLRARRRGGREHQRTENGDCRQALFIRSHAFPCAVIPATFC
jgi:hypothetical protein